MNNIVLVASGGALGAVLRYVAVTLVARAHSAAFPVGTVAVNVVGSVLIGVLMARFAAAESDSARLFLVTGVLGGFTTFSAFSWDALQLMQRGQMAQAGIYILGSVGLSLVAVAAGYQIGR